MRRMRELTAVHYIALTLPVIGAAFGVRALLRHHRDAQQTAEVMKPSQFKSELPQGSRKIASLAGDRNREHVSHDVGRDEEVIEEAANEISETEPASKSTKPSVALEAAANDASETGKTCDALEYRGEGLQRTQVTKTEWGVVMDQFHGAKSQLLGWLTQHRKELGDATAMLMEQQVKTLKIQRPPSVDEPDLAWRGVGVFTQNAESEPILKMGGGFVKLALKHPARAKFEMARLVAQAWAPCELGRVAVNDAWTPLLKCLNVNEAQGCASGTFSEGGWAVSSTLAVAVSPPGCQVPAFQNPEFAKCLNKIPLSVTRLDNSSVGARVARLEGESK